MKKPYIAIVDDDSAFSAYLRTFLSLRGYEARCYSRGDELLASMKQSEPPDAVLLDVMMPGLDGLATLRALKASRPEAQVIMLSGPQPGIHDRRGRASRRGGLRREAGRSGRPREIALDVAIKNAIEKNRLVSELTELRQQLSDDEDRSVWGNSEKMRGDRDGDRTGCGQRRHRSAPGRERRRQGARVAGDPPAVNAQKPPVRRR